MEKRLKSKIIIDKLFVDGKSLFIYPFKMVFLHQPHFLDQKGLQLGVSVSKRSFKKAVDRNKVKRRMREAIRLYIKENPEIEPLQFYAAMMFVYVGKEILEYQVISKSIHILLKKWSKVAGKVSDSQS